MNLYLLLKFVSICLWFWWFCIHHNLKKRELKFTIKVLHSCVLRRRFDVFIVGIPRQYQERTRAGSRWSVYDLVWPLRHQLPGHLRHEDSATSHQQWGLTTGLYFWIINLNNLIYFALTVELQLIGIELDPDNQIQSM